MSFLEESCAPIFSLRLLWICFASVHGALVPPCENGGPLKQRYSRGLEKERSSQRFAKVFWNDARVYQMQDEDAYVGRWLQHHQNTGKFRARCLVIAFCMNTLASNTPFPPARAQDPACVHGCCGDRPWWQDRTCGEPGSPGFLTVHHPSLLRLSKWKCQSHGPAAFRPDRREVISSAPWQALPTSTNQRDEEKPGSVLRAPELQSAPGEGRLSVWIRAVLHC